MTTASNQAWEAVRAILARDDDFDAFLTDYSGPELYTLSGWRCPLFRWLEARLPATVQAVSASAYTITLKIREDGRSVNLVGRLGEQYDGQWLADFVQRLDNLSQLQRMVAPARARQVLAAVRHAHGLTTPGGKWRMEA